MKKVMVLIAVLVICSISATALALHCGATDTFKPQIARSHGQVASWSYTLSAVTNLSQFTSAGLANWFAGMKKFVLTQGQPCC